MILDIRKRIMIEKLVLDSLELNEIVKRVDDITIDDDGIVNVKFVIDREYADKQIDIE